MSAVLLSSSRPLRNYFQRLSQIFAVLTAFVLPLSTAALMIFFTATVLCCLLAGDCYEKYLILRYNPMALMFILFFALFFFGFSYTSVQWPIAFHTLIKYSKFLLGFFLFSTFRHEKTANIAFFAFLLAATLTLLFSFIKFFSHLDLLHRFVSDSGVFKDHIFTGFLLAFTSYCFAVFAFSIKKSWRYLFILLFLVAAYNVLFINLSRSGYVVLFSLLLLLAWQKFSGKGLFAGLLIAVFLCGGLLFLPANFKERFNLAHSEIIQYKNGSFDTSVGLRLEFYNNSLKLLKEHPWIGTGTGSFAQDYLAVAQDKHFATQNPHNEYLNIAVQFGLLGVVVLLGMFIVHAWTSLRLQGMRQHFAQAILVSIAVGSLFNSWLMDVTQGCFYVFFTALLFAGLPYKSKDNVSGILQSHDRDQ
ncbi:MAG: O-antigen ligase family protein [Candidatus Aquirickettsiella sp.]